MRKYCPTSVSATKPVAFLPFLPSDKKYLFGDTAHMKQFKLTLLGMLLIGCTEPTVPISSESALLRPRLDVAAAANEAVFPAAYAALMGETNNSFPHSQRNLRYQQVFMGSDVVDSTLVGVCLRTSTSVFLSRSRTSIRRAATSS